MGRFSSPACPVSEAVSYACSAVESLTRLSLSLSVRRSLFPGVGRKWMKWSFPAGDRSQRPVPFRTSELLADPFLRFALKY